MLGYNNRSQDKFNNTSGQFDRLSDSYNQPGYNRNPEQRYNSQKLPLDVLRDNRTSAVREYDRECRQPHNNYNDRDYRALPHMEDTGRNTRPIPREDMRMNTRPVPREDMRMNTRPVPREDMRMNTRPIPRENMRMNPRPISGEYIPPMDSRTINVNRRMDRNPDKKSSIVKIIFLVNMIAFGICAIFLGSYFYKSAQVKAKQDDLAGLLDSASATGEDRYASIRDDYPDLVGRLLFHNYNDILDLPVMQTKDEPMYYLYRDQDGEDSNWGTPFLDYRSDVGKPTSNFVVYAHNMKDLSQFGSLKNYKTKTYWEQYKTIEFETMYEERMEYEVVASFYSQIYDKDVEGVFKYYRFFDTDSSDEYDDFINNVLDIDNYSTGIKPQFGEQLLTLSTCDYTKDVEEGRFVVVARKAGKSEDTGSIDELVESIETTTTPTATTTPTKTPVQATKKPVTQTDTPTKTPTKTYIPVVTQAPEVTSEPQYTQTPQNTKEPEQTRIPFITNEPDGNDDNNNDNTSTNEPEVTEKPWNNFWDNWN